MSTPSSQGSVVTWNGAQVGRLTGFRWTAATAVFEETTGWAAPVIGVGVNSRVVKQYDCTSIDPGGCDISLRGVLPVFVSQVGHKAVLSLSFMGGGFSLWAYLETFDVTGNVGEFLNGTARFRFTGEGFA